jgi:hypothetical protein
MSGLKQGDKLLLPVEVFEIVEWATDARAVKVQTIGDDYFKLYPEDVEVLIPADRLTDLEAENSKLRSALKAIKHMLEVPNHRDITPEMIYRTASKALDGDAK